MDDKLLKTLEQALAKGIALQDIERICLKKSGGNQGKRSKRSYLCAIFVLLAAILLAAIGVLISSDEFSDIMLDIAGVTPDDECLLDHNELTHELTRPLFDCSKCANLKSMPVETELSMETFENKYAYTGIPVVVRNGAKNWTALDVYSVKYFHGIYSKYENAFKKMDEECQFMPYYTPWDSLEEALSMSDDQADLKGERWYIGWSNCVEDVEKELRKHYKKPSFLSDSGGSVSMDWIFMGGSGVGAPPHLDSVGRPSWQAQLSGTKTWFLYPVPECAHVCHDLSVVMNKSDIIAVDTDRWYHSTFVHPGEISITIGSEYD